MMLENRSTPDTVRKRHQMLNRLELSSAVKESAARPDRLG